MARGGVEAAVWDLEARLKSVPLWEHIGGGWFKEIACGVSIGIQNTRADLLKTIEKEVAAGYQRIKIKIKPGWDVDVVREVREDFPGDPPDGGCQLGLHARRRRPPASSWTSSI